MSYSAPAGSMSPKGNISGYKMRSMPNFPPQLMQLFEQLLGGAKGGLGGGFDFLNKLASGDPEQFGQLEAPAQRQLQGQLGQIGSRFANQGALGSSGFQQMASGAATDLSERLQSQRMGLQQGAMDRLLSLSQNLLQQKPYENFLEKKTDWTKLIGQLLGGAAGSIGGPIGSGIGAAALPKILQLLGLGGG